MAAIAQMKDKTNLKKKITREVCRLYDMVSTRPTTPFHFPVGRDAALTVGYPADVLDRLPAHARESFAGVGYHFRSNVIKHGDRVLDIGSGSGTDLLIAAELVGPQGKVVGIDITDSMIAKARRAAREQGLRHVSVIKADAETLPFPGGSFDVVISNGVINLIPDKPRVFSEIFRVLAPGGVLSFADIVLGRPISKESRQNPQLWAECIVGAQREDAFVEMIRQGGFQEVAIVDRFDYFAHSPSEDTQKIARLYKAHAVVLVANRPPRKNDLTRNGGERM